MSRIGKKPIPLPKDVNFDLKGDLLAIKGPKGELIRKIHPRVKIQTENDQIVVSVNDGAKGSKSLHGLFRALIANMVTGVSQGFIELSNVNAIRMMTEMIEVLRGYESYQKAIKTADEANAKAINDVGRA